MKSGEHFILLPTFFSFTVIDISVDYIIVQRVSDTNKRLLFGIKRLAAAAAAKSLQSCPTL